MAQRGKPIDESQIVKDGAVPKIVGEFNEWLKILNNIDSAFKTIAKDVSQIKPPTNAKEWSEMNKSMKVMEGNYKAQYDNLIKIERLEQARERTKQQQLRTQKLETQGTTRQLTEYQKLSRSLTEMRNRYKDLATMQSQGVKLSKQEVAEMSKLQKEVRSLDKTLKDIDGSVGQYQRNVGNYSGAWKGVKSTLSSLLPIFGGLSIVRTSFNYISEFDEKLADVAKTTGLTTKEVAGLSLELGKLDTRSTITELQELASAAGRLNITAKEDILSFVKAADTAFVALGDDLSGSAEDIATTLGKVSSAYGDEVRYGIGEAIEKTGSTLNTLASSSKASASAILDFTNRLAGVASQAGISQTDIQALGALFDDAGQSIEVSATTISTLLPELGKNYKDFAKIAGMSADEFKQLASKDAIEALKRVAQGAKSSESGLIGLNQTLEAYGISSARAAGIVGVLSSNTEKLTKLQGIAKKAFNENTSLADEFATKNNTLSGAFEKLSNRFRMFIIELNQGAGAGSSIKGFIQFLTSNLPTILNLFGKLITLWVSYKAVMKSINIYDEIKKMGGLSNAFKTQSENIKDATKSADGYGKALKAIGWAALITVGIELARVFYDIASGTAEAREQYERYQKALGRGQEDAQNTLSRLNKLREEERNQLALNGKASEDDIKRIDERYKDRIKIEINTLNELKKIAKERAVLTDDDQARLEAALNKSEILRSTYEKNLVKAYRNTNLEIQEYNTEIKILKGELNEVNSSDTDAKINSLTGQGGKDFDKSKQSISDYTKAIRDLKVAMTEEEDAITTDFVKSVEELNNSTIDAIDKVNEEREKDNITQIKAEEYIQALKDKNAYDFHKLKMKYEEDLYNFQREQELKALENRKLELEQRSQLSEMELGRSASQQRIAEIARDNKLREEVLNDRLLTDEQRHKKLEELEKEHQKRMNAILVEYLQASIQFQLEQINKLTEVYGEASKEVEEAGQRYLELEEQLQNALKKSADNIDSDKGLKGALQKVSGYFSSLMDAVMGKINETIDRAITGQNRLIDNSKSMINFLQQAAAAGNLAASESILAEEKKIEDAQKKIEKLEKNRQRAQLITGLLGSFSAKTASGDKNALTSTLAESAILTAFLRTLPSFDIGADRLYSSGNGVDGKGGFHAIVHPDERILTADENRKIGFDMKNEDVANVMYKYRNGMLTGGSQPQIIVQDNTEKVLKEIKQGFSQINNWNMSVEQLFSTITVMVEKKKGNFTEKNVKNFKA